MMRDIAQDVRFGLRTLRKSPLFTLVSIATLGLGIGVSLAVFGIALGGVLYSAYLTWLEVAVIHAICVWCVVSAFIVTAILAITAVALVRDEVIGS